MKIHGRAGVAMLSRWWVVSAEQLPKSFAVRWKSLSHSFLFYFRTTHFVQEYSKAPRTNKRQKHYPQTATQGTRTQPGYTQPAIECDTEPTVAHTQQNHQYTRGQSAGCTGVPRLRSTPQKAHDRQGIERRHSRLCREGKPQQHVSIAATQKATTLAKPPPSRARLTLTHTQPNNHT